MVKDRNSIYTLDNIDRGILYELQLDARNTTHEQISETVGVSPSTVRNRIARLEAVEIIFEYVENLADGAMSVGIRVGWIEVDPDLITR